MHPICVKTCPSNRAINRTSPMGTISTRGVSGNEQRGQAVAMKLHGQRQPPFDVWS